MQANLEHQASSIITFTSDFGRKDGYVGIVKGAISRINVNARVIDLAHEIKPFDVKGAAWIICNAYKFFPSGTVHLVVVDPAVGSQQRRILLTNGEHHFVGPDSGVFSLILQQTGEWRAFHLKNEIFFLQEISSSFHARDIFGPVAAHLSLGIEASKFGPEIKLDSLDCSSYSQADIKDNSVEGEIIYIDRYGNSISNIAAVAIPSAISAKCRCHVENKEIGELVQTYSSVDKGKPLALIGSHGFLEIAINQGNAGEDLNLEVGSRVSLTD